MTDDKNHVMIVGCTGEPDDVRAVHTPEELAELMGWSVTACRDLYFSGSNTPCIIIPTPAEPEPERTNDALRQTIKNTVSDCAARFAYYDRKDDEELSADDIVAAITNGVVTLDELAQWFRDGLGYEDELDGDAVTVEGVPK